MLPYTKQQAKKNVFIMTLINFGHVDKFNYFLFLDQVS